MSAQIIRLADRRRAPAPAGRPTILERINTIAELLGIDVEAPFRPNSKPFRIPVKLGDRNPPPSAPKPRRKP